jgi:hypothetical protein
VSPIDLNDDELKKLLQLQLTVKPELKEYELKRKALNENGHTYSGNGFLYLYLLDL